MRSIYLFLALFVLRTLLSAQTSSLEGELLVQLSPGKSVENLLKLPLAQKAKLSVISNSPNALFFHRFRFDERQISKKEMMRLLSAQPEVLYVQPNHILQARRTPDDLKYLQWQWDKELMQLPDAWEYSTGGIASGDSIVVAIIDGGGDLNHEDLQENIWKNHQEIPGDGVDNDANGYVDDVYGWQLDNQNDTHSLSNHGTSVAGIIGAKGNNALGIAGINWDLKMMLISAAEQNLLLESNILEAYAYVLMMKRRYLSSNGEEGAYVVATNLSAGIDFADAEDFPLWCSIYDSLGEVGILNVGATMNRRENVDKVGDMPTSCASEFLMTVTNSTEFDALNLNAAWGPIHVDVAAPGAVYSTRANDSYNTFAGTSGAAPQLAGAIALLASLPNTKWQRLLKEQPLQAMQLIRSVIMSTADQNQNLIDKIQSGGRLNIGKAMKALDQLFQSPNKVEIQQLGQGISNLLFYDLEPGSYSYSIYDYSGRLRYMHRFEIDRKEEVYLTQLDLFSNRPEYLLLHLSKGKQTVNTIKILNY